MSSKIFKKEAMVGFISEISGEKRGPSKYYRRFIFIASNNETFDGWIFGDTSIEETSAGKLLMHAHDTKRTVRLYGAINEEQGND